MMRSSRSDETLQQKKLQVEPEPERELAEPDAHSCLKAIGLITGTGGRAAKLISWFPADGSTAASGALGVAKHAQIAAPSVAADSKSSELQDEELEWFGLPREELASLLAPAAALCDTDFDLQVDALRFVGRPTIIGGANSAESNEAGAARNKALAQGNVGDAEHVSPRRKRLDSQNSSKRLGEQDESTPVEYSGGGRDEGQEPGGEKRRLNTRSNSQELLGQRRTHRDTRTNSQKLLEIREKEAKRIFHVVFVIDSHKLTGRQGESVKAWQALATRLTSALLLEEKRCGYIAEEIATMRRLREEHNSQASPAAISEKSGSGSVTDGGAAIDQGTTKGKPKPLAQQFLEHSDLARVLEVLYRGLVSPAGGAGVLINGWIRLDLYVESVQGTRSMNSSNAAIRLGQQQPEQVHPHHPHHHRYQIDPEQSYMLLRSKQVLLAELPAYASPAVRAAIERANPCLSVYTLAESMYISVERLVTVIHQLVQWKVARVIEKFDTVVSRFIAAPSITIVDLRRLAPTFVAEQLLATMRMVSFGEGPSTPGLDRELEVGGSLAPGESPLLTEETVSEWVSTLGMRRAAVRLLAIPLMYQVQKRATNDVDYRGPYMDSETQQTWWIAAHAAVTNTWPNSTRHDSRSSSTSVRLTQQHREALLNEIESYEQILMSRTIPHTLPDQELRAAGRFSLFLTAVRRVLDDIKHARQNERQWDQNAFGNDLGSDQRMPSPVADKDTDLPVELGAFLIPLALVLDHRCTSSRLCVRAGICEVLQQFGTSLSMANASPSQRSFAAQTQTFSSSLAAPELSLKSISEMTVGPLADGRVMRTPQDVVRLLTWLLQKEVIVPVFEHFYLCIPTTPAAGDDGMQAWTEEEESPRTPRTPTFSWESSSSTGSGSSRKTEGEGESVAGIGPTGTRGSDGGTASTVSTQTKLEATAHAAGLSNEQLAVLQSLQTPGRERWRQDRGANDTPPPTEEDLGVFLGWCPLLRGGCRSADLMRVTKSVDSDASVSADWSRSSGGGDGGIDIGVTTYRKDFVEHVLEKFSSCLVKIVHEVHVGGPRPKGAS